MLSYKYKETGFTIIELAITLSIVSIVAAMLLITWPSFTLNLNAQAEMLADDIRYTQNLAMTRNERFYLIKISANGYQIRNSTDNVITLPTGQSTMSLGSGMAFGTFSGLPSDLIAFGSSGIPYINTTVPGTALTSTATMTIVSGTGLVVISIYPETGRVTVQ